jgi:hypothetical protein
MIDRLADAPANTTKARCERPAVAFEPAVKAFDLDHDAAGPYEHRHQWDLDEQHHADRADQDGQHVALARAAAVADVLHSQQAQR